MSTINEMRIVKVPIQAFHPAYELIKWENSQRKKFMSLRPHGMIGHLSMKEIPRSIERFSLIQALLPKTYSI
jgi:hypothetical protein